MRSCPKCGNACRKGATKCPSCGAPLPSEDGAALLISTDSAAATQIAEGALRSAKIPYKINMRDERQGLGVIIGNSVLGADLFVPEELLDKAREAVGIAGDQDTDETASDGNNDGSPAEAQNSAEPASPAARPRRKDFWLSVCLILLAAAVLCGFFALDWVLDLVRKLMGFR